MNVLSLFDGISAGMVALERAGIEVTNYYASEIDKYAIQVSQKNYPSIIRLGDVTKWEDWDIDFGSIDLVTGGFPCQSWSVAGKQLGDKDDRGMLFWTMLDIMKKVLEHNPNAKFLIENVKMKKEFEQYISYHTEQALGEVTKILINSALVSAQNRERYYWTNIPNVTQPEDKGVLLKDILEDFEAGTFITNPKLLNFKHNTEKCPTITATSYKEPPRVNKPFVDRDKSFCVDANYFKGGNLKSYFEKNRRQLVFSDSGLCHCADADLNGHDFKLRVYSPEGKSPTLTAGGGGNLEPKIITDKIPASASMNPPSIDKGIWWRKLTPLEAERLQTFPDGYTDCVSNTQRYKSLGNSWTVDVIAHIFGGLK